MHTCLGEVTLYEGVAVVLVYATAAPNDIPRHDTI